MFNNFTEEARKILNSAKEEMYELKHPYVGSEHMLLAILKDKNNISKKLKEYNLNYDKLKDEIVNIIGVGSKESDWFLYTPLLKRVIENATIDSKENNKGEVTVEHLFSSLLEEGEGVAIRIMIGLDIDLDALYNEFSYKIGKTKKSKNKKLVLDELGLDLTEQARNKKLDPVIGREKEILRLIEVLSRKNKNNPLLIGEAGVGKTAIVEELSKRIANNDVPLCLKGKRVISLDMASAVAGTKYRGEFEDRIRKIIKELEDNQDIILFIDEVHTLIGAGGAEGAIDASNIFKPALARGKVKCIGATTTLEYKNYIEKDSALERRFQKINIEIPDKKNVLNILKHLKTTYQDYHNVKISDKIIEDIVDLSNKYVYDRNQPDAAIDILDEVCAKVSLKENSYLKKYNNLLKKVEVIMHEKNEAITQSDFDKASKIKDKEKELLNKINQLELKLYKKNNQKEVLLKDVHDVISDKTKIPIYEFSDCAEIISKIENKLKKEIIGQNEAINELIKLFKRIKIGFKENKCYSFLLSGPSGVGKTHLAKLFGNELVGKDNVIKLDMSEYSEPHSVSKIIGSPPGYIGYSDNQNVLEEVRNKPYSVLILDEIEKAHSSILSLLFQILDDSKIKDSKGRTVRFDNVIIIMTSNEGFIKNQIGFNKTKKQDVIKKLKENFSVPFINRINNIVLFEYLTKENVETIVLNKLNKIIENYKDININFEKNIKTKIIEKINYQEEGARSINKFLLEFVENQIIDKIVEDKKDINISLEKVL